MIEDNNIYYNIRIKGSDTNDNRARFNVNSIQTVVDNPLNYELAVERFKVPTTVIPIFIWKGDDYFRITMTYDNSTVVQPLLFIPNTNNQLYGNAIWNYQEFVDIINVALSSAYSALKLLEPLMPPTEAPFITYNSDTQLLTFNIEQVYSNTTKVYLSEFLYLLVVSFQNYNLKLPSGDYIFQMLCKDNRNNSTIINGKNYYSTKQEYSTLFLWNDFTTLLFETNLIPVNPEYLDSQNNDTRRILSDFQPLEGLNDRVSIQYYPSGPLRFYDLTNNTALSDMDLNIYWEDKTGTLYPLYLTDDDVLTMKILFKKKYKY
tara:strand:- start:1253 stop:2206 length:954 start_codon:yes stop_codon:yes gene_type:complete